MKNFLKKYVKYFYITILFLNSDLSYGESLNISNGKNRLDSARINWDNNQMYIFSHHSHKRAIAVFWKKWTLGISSFGQTQVPYVNFYFKLFENFHQDRHV